MNTAYPEDDDVVRCRHCTSPWLRKWGAARGRPRYRCYECGRTSVVPATDPAGAEHLERRQREILLSMLEPRPLIESAAALGVDPKRLLLERHRVMQALVDCYTPAPLTGDVLLVRIPLLERRLCMYALASPTCVRPRLISGPLNPDAKAAQPILTEHLGPGAVLINQTPALRGFADCAMQLRIDYYGIGNLPPGRQRPHVIPTLDYGRAAWKWMIRFRGFRPEHLPRYIAWYQAIRSVDDAPDRESAWLELCERALTPSRSWL